ncbi:hypothetical protein [Anatilimnocola floriformis]|uniref:hypothetical protein n=1 Tax=Anatilimnocola floriformis TaxID=2948575 RepID=UPI0020C37698|nr:hypothetical protein [Anatilimnocola floriformis]
MQNLLIPAVFLAFALWWCFIIWVISFIGGWRALAKRFGVRQLPPGKKYHLQSAAFSKGGLPCNYGNCLTMIVAEQGLGIAIFPAFRPGHPPLLIPWSEFYRPRQKTVLWYWKFFEAEIGEPPIVTVCLPEWLFAQANQAMADDGVARDRAANEGTKEYDDAH